VSYVKPTQPFLRKGHPLNDGLVAAWLLGEGGGDTTRDLSGRSLHGTLVNGPTWVVTPYGWGLKFNNTSHQYVQLPDETSEMLGGSSAVTVSVWVKRTATGELDQILDLTISSTFSKLSLRFLADNRIRVGGRSTYPEDFQFKNTTTTWTDAQWHHVAATLDLPADEITIYVDGLQQATSGSSGSPSWANEVFSAAVGSRQTVGAAVSGSNPLNGRIAMLAIYNRALTPAEIRTLARLDDDPWEQWRPRSQAWYPFLGPSIVPGPYRVAGTAFFTPGREAGQTFSPGQRAGGIYLPGATAGHAV